MDIPLTRDPLCGDLDLLPCGTGVLFLTDVGVGERGEDKPSIGWNLWDNLGEGGFLVGTIFNGTVSV